MLNHAYSQVCRSHAALFQFDSLLCSLVKFPVTPHTVWHEFFAVVNFRGLAIFCVLRELLFAIFRNVCE